MGLLAWLGFEPADLTTAATAYPSPLRSEDIAAADPVAAAAFGLSTGSNTVTREEAMTVPAVRRGRQVIAGVLGTLPLVATRGADLEHVDRALLEQPDPNTTRQHVITWTVDDLLFYGVAWWRVLERDSNDYPTRVERLAPGRVTLELPAGRVRVDGDPVPDRDLVRFDGPDEGVLRYGGRTLRTCLALEDAVRRFATMDVPLGVLKLAEGATELSADEVNDLLDQWETARRERTTAYLNRAVDYKAEAFTAADTQLAEARQYQAGEVARLLNLPPRYVNAPSASGMTYTNVQSERLELVDLSLAPYIVALEQRLSMGDVTPRGQSVRVDLSGFTRGDQKTALESGALAIGIGAANADEVRAAVYNRPPLTPDTPATPVGSPSA